MQTSYIAEVKRDLGLPTYDTPNAVEELKQLRKYQMPEKVQAIKDALKQWKKPKTKMRNLLKLGVPKDLAYKTANSRRGYWFVTHTVSVNIALTKERLIHSGFYDLAIAYQSVHVNY